jgi:hypothetical protein
MAFQSDVLVVGSAEKAKNGYGQNGYQGASSDLPGQKTTSGFLPQSSVDPSKWQTRDVSQEQYPTAFGCPGAKPGPKVPGKVDRG